MTGRDRFRPGFHWSGLPTDDAALEFTIANVGSRNGTIRDITFRTPFPRSDDETESRRWMDWQLRSDPEVWPALPLTLDVDEVSPRFELQLEGIAELALVDELLAGNARLVVWDASGRERDFPVEPPRDHPWPPSPEHFRRRKP